VRHDTPSVEVTLTRAQAEYVISALLTPDLLSRDLERETAIARRIRIAVERYERIRTEGDWARAER